MGHMPFEHNFDYPFHILYEEKLELYSKSKAADKLASKLKNLITSYQESFHNA